MSEPVVFQLLTWMSDTERVLSSEWQLLFVLGWLKSLFGIFSEMLQKNLKELIYYFYELYYLLLLVLL